VHILIATDAEWIVDEVTSALGDSGVTFIVCRDGRVVADQVKKHEPELAVFDLQIGSMGGMAVTMSLRLDESADALPHVPVLMLVDRRADLHLARRSGAEGWLIKPVDALRLKRAAAALIAGGTYTEGVPAVHDGAQAEAADEASDDLADGAGEAPSPEEEPASAG
jgi:DNA-binding response OmpR family regulator